MSKRKRQSAADAEERFVQALTTELTPYVVAIEAMFDRFQIPFSSGITVLIMVTMHSIARSHRVQGMEPSRERAIEALRCMVAELEAPSTPMSPEPEQKM